MNRVQPIFDSISPGTSNTKNFQTKKLANKIVNQNWMTSPPIPSCPSSICCTLDNSSNTTKNACLCQYCISPKIFFPTFCICGISAGSTKSILSSCDTLNRTASSGALTVSGYDLSEIGKNRSEKCRKSRIFPSTRFLIAFLLCFCFISLSISTSNISVSMVCMIQKPPSVVATVKKELFNKNANNLAPFKDKFFQFLNLPNKTEIAMQEIKILRIKKSVHNTSNWKVIENLINIKSDVDNLSKYKNTSEKNSEITKTTAPTTKQEYNIVQNTLEIGNHPLNDLNNSVMITEIWEMLKKIGVNNATLQYGLQKDFVPSSPSISLTKCQLTRFRKHANIDENFWTQLDDVRREEKDNLQKRYLPFNFQSNDIKRKTDQDNQLTVVIQSCYESEKLVWSSTDQGMVFAAQNAGSLLMLVTGTQADRLNSKWTIVIALFLLIISNFLLPIVAKTSVWLVVGARVLTGFSDALMQPSTSSMITRWFPPKERPFAIGLITGGRQIGTLMILPVAGFLCSKREILNGWPAIFYLSAFIVSIVLITWVLMSADKPSKHCCTSSTERFFVEQKISEENVGKRNKRKAVPWRKIITCRPVYIGVAALICHEYPLLLPKYINDILKFSITTNGIVSALPIGVLFLSKTFSSSLSSLIGAQKTGRFVMSSTNLVKTFNAVASLGLGVCVAIVPLLTSENQKVLAIIVLCLANAFAGLHTPGVQTALLQLAPAYSGIITGIAFGFVAIFSIINKVLSNYIVQSGSINEWIIVFWIAAFVAVLPVGFFTLWGSAERQSWATSIETRVSLD